MISEGHPSSPKYTVRLMALPSEELVQCHLPLKPLLLAAIPEIMEEKPAVALLLVKSKSPLFARHFNPACVEKFPKGNSDWLAWVRPYPFSFLFYWIVIRGRWWSNIPFITPPFLLVWKGGGACVAAIFICYLSLLGCFAYWSWAMMQWGQRRLTTAARILMERILFIRLLNPEEVSALLFWPVHFHCDQRRDANLDAPDGTQSSSWSLDPHADHRASHQDSRHGNVEAVLLSLVSLYTPPVQRDSSCHRDLLFRYCCLMTTAEEKWFLSLVLLARSTTCASRLLSKFS